MLTSKKKRPVGIIILDGWGVAPAWGGNAISQAKTRNFDLIWKNYPKTLLQASGINVGLPMNSPGNSEAGHLNIGAGHIVPQDAGLIDSEIENKSFFKNQVLLDGIDHAKQNNSNVHIMGLLSNVGTHSHVKHLYALLEFLKENKFSRVYIHLFSDGRDSPPMSGIELAEEVENEIKKIGVGKIASLSGRFFAMDRDNRWGRIARAYNMLVKAEGDHIQSIRSAFSSAYARGATDEFIEPILICDITKEIVSIDDNDTVFFFNFRSDRAKEITEAFLSDKIDQFPDRKKLNNLFFASFVIFQDGIPGKSVFRPELIDYPLARVWSENNLRQYHSAETEKYPHITYFINGGRDKAFDGEDRIMIPSIKTVKTYDFCPKMSAKGVTDTFVSELLRNKYDSFMINFANADMVGHTGSLTATVQAIEFVDICLNKILSTLTNIEGTALIFADHGNAEQMVNPHSGTPDTEHTTNPVPFIIFDNQQKSKSIKLVNDGNLSHIAPTILDLMGIDKAKSMTEKSLIIRE